jgi:phospholipase/carboxylesterase
VSKYVSWAAFALCVGLSIWLGSACTRSRAESARLQFVERVIGGDPNAELPLLIGLHGLGDTPEQFLELLGGLAVPLRIVAPRAPDPWRQGTSGFPIDDLERAPRLIVERAKLVVELADQLRKTRKVRGLPLVTGFSQGGILSFAIAAYQAEHFAAAFPLAGSLFAGMPPYRKAPKSFRVVAFHGEEDTRVPYAGALRTVAALRQVGTQVSFTGLPGVGHSLPPALVARWYRALREQLASP